MHTGGDSSSQEEPNGSTESPELEGVTELNGENAESEEPDIEVPSDEKIDEDDNRLAEQIRESLSNKDSILENLQPQSGPSSGLPPSEDTGGIDDGNGRRPKRRRVESKLYSPSMKGMTYAPGKKPFYT